MHGICAAAFSGSHLCFLAEYERAHATTAPPSEGAWADGSTYNDWFEIDVAMPRSGRSTSASSGSNCDNWTGNDSSYYGYTVTSPEAINQLCDVLRPLACCGG